MTTYDTISEKRGLDISINSNLIFIGGVQQVDPKEMGTQPTKVGSPTKSNSQNLCQPTYNQLVKVTKTTSGEKEGRSGGLT